MGWHEHSARLTNKVNVIAIKQTTKMKLFTTLPLFDSVCFLLILSVHNKVSDSSGTQWEKYKKICSYFDFPWLVMVGLVMSTVDYYRCEETLI